MRIIFTREPDGTEAAISLDAVYEGALHTELYWADLNDTEVRWQDDYSNPVKFNSVPEAKNYVLSNYSRHKPISNGSRYQLDDDGE